MPSFLAEAGLTRKGWEMKNALLISAMVFVSSVFFAAVSFSETNEMPDYMAKRSMIKVYLKDFVNESANKDISADDFKKAVETAMRNRKSVLFEIAGSPDASDVIVSCKIKCLRYLHRGPFKPSPGIEDTLLDAAATMTLNFVEMDAQFTVTDAKTGKLLYDVKLYDYKKRKMKSEESIPIIYDRVARIFLWKAFGKGPHAYRNVNSLSAT